MLNFLPVFFVFITILVLLVLQRIRIPIGTTWLILAGMTILNWGSLLFLRTRLPDALVIANWFPGAISSDSLILHMDVNTWLLVFALASLLVTILFSSAGHLHEPTIFRQLIEILLLTAVGMLALLADSPLAFLLTWALIDLVELIVFTIVLQEQTLNVQTIAIFLGRTLGLGFVIMGMALSAKNQTPLELGNTSGAVLTLLIAGAALRLGVLPLHLPYLQEMEKRRNLSNILRLLAPLSVFAFLSKLAAPQMITGWNLLILLFAVLSSLFGAVNWFNSKDELRGRPYWLLFFSGFALLSYLRGQPEGVVIWGLLMVTVGGWISLCEYHTGKIDFLLPVAILNLSGIPFTPAAIALIGIMVGPFQGLNIILWLSLALIMAGIIRISLKTSNSSIGNENWMRLFYSLGMRLLMFSPWVILVFKYANWKTIQSWWVAAITLLILTSVLLLNYSVKVRSRFQNSRVVKGFYYFEPFAQWMNRFLHLDWFYQFLAFLFKIQQRIIEGINVILEGAGGILWALVFLALLVSLLVSGKSG